MSWTKAVSTCKARLTMNEYECDPIEENENEDEDEDEDKDM